jgi:hypothetical protein
MASFSHVLICSGLALLIYFFIGLPIAARSGHRPIALMLAPAIGWAIHSPIALLLFYFADMTRPVVITGFAAPAVVALIAAAIDWPIFGKGWRLSVLTALALIGAALLALAVAAAVLPKLSTDGVALAAPIFDHSKVAMVNEMARLGVPPANPFFGGTGSPTRLVYYYLWHFTAAELSLLANVSGWEADASLTWFTAFASLAMIIGFALWLGGIAASGLWIVVLAGTGSLRPLLNGLAGTNAVEAYAGYQSGFAGWLFQTSWAPQHMASAMCAVLAIFLLNELARRPRFPAALVLAVVMAASFESSVWIGGIVLPLAALLGGVVMLQRAEPAHRKRIVLYALAAALMALLLISPLFYDQFQFAAARAGGPPFAIAPYDVLTDQPEGYVGNIANLLAYWFILLVVEFPAFYLTGVIAMAVLVVSFSRARERNSIVLAFSLLLLVSLTVPWFLVSTPGENNDLAWRAVLPGVLLLIMFSSLALSRWLEKPVSLAVVPALALVLLGLPDGAMLIYGNAVVTPNASAKVFATTPALWQAVRRHTSSAERVANNPSFLEHMTPWEVNISWALLSNRRSCYAGPAMVGPFSALSDARNNLINAQFKRVFDGDADQTDIGQLATQYNCSVAVVTPQDGAWRRDPFAASPSYRLVEDNAAWRIYKLTTLAGSGSVQARFRQTN